MKKPIEKRILRKASVKGAKAIHRLNQEAEKRYNEAIEKHYN